MATQQPQTDHDERHIQSLVDNPVEGLNVEIKTWLEPRVPKSISKIVKAILAIRNRNGGFLLIGFDDRSLLPDEQDAPDDVRGAFHIDYIQGLVSRFSSDPFEVKISFPRRGDREYPVIEIPAGVRVPVAAKSDLIDQGNKLIHLGAVYFRTLGTNGTASTAVAQPSDWSEIVDICFNNREADIGQFFRRQFSQRGVQSLRAFFEEFGTSTPSVTLGQRAEQLLQDGEARFKAAINSRSLNDTERSIVDCGMWSVAMVFDPPQVEKVPDRDFLNKFTSSNPNYTGWPVWIESSSLGEERHRPKIVQKRWESLVLLADFSHHLDFSTVDPKGEFYHCRALWDDLTSNVKRGAALDPSLAVIFVAEAIAIGLSYARELDEQKKPRRLAFYFRWTKLKGRQLFAWGNSGMVLPGNIANNDEATTSTELDGKVTQNAIAQFVDEATQDLFATFNGYRYPIQAIENICQRLIERKFKRL